MCPPRGRLYFVSMFYLPLKYCNKLLLMSRLCFSVFYYTLKKFNNARQKLAKNLHGSNISSTFAAYFHN